MTVDQIATMAARHLEQFNDFYSWITDRKSRRTMPGRLERAGYVSIRNPDDNHDGQWVVGRKRQVVYARKELSPAEQFKAVAALIREADALAKRSKAKRAPVGDVEDAAPLLS